MTHAFIRGCRRRTLQNLRQRQTLQHPRKSLHSINEYSSISLIRRVPTMCVSCSSYPINDPKPSFRPSFSTLKSLQVTEDAIKEDSTTQQPEEALFSSFKSDMERYLNQDSNVSTEETLEMMKKCMSFEREDFSTRERAENIKFLLHHWLSLYSNASDKKRHLPETSRPFELALQAWRDAGCGDEAASVLDEWGYMLEGDMAMAPTLTAFHTVMDAYASGPSSFEALEAVENLLLLLEQWQTAGNVWSKPQVETFSHVVRVMARCGQNGSMRASTNLPIPLRDLLDKLVEAFSMEASKETKPTDVYFLVRAYYDVIASTRTYDVAVYLDLLHEMKGHLEGHDLQRVALRLSPLTAEDTICRIPQGEGLDVCLDNAYELVMKQVAEQAPDPEMAATALTRLVSHLEQMVTGEWALLPSPQHYEMAITACAEKVAVSTSNQQEDLLEIESLINRMESRYLSRFDNASYDDSSKEKSITRTVPLRLYERIISILSLPSGRADVAQTLLSHIVKLKKRGLVDASKMTLTRCWNHVMMARLQEENFAAVLSLWREMKARSHSLEPDSLTYSTVLSALTSSAEPHAAERAHTILMKMIKDYETSSNDLSRPVAAHYGYVIVAWSRSPHKSAAWRAQDLLNCLKSVYGKQKTDDMKPRLADYSAVITAWGRSRRKGDPHRALAIFKEVERLGLRDQDLEPDVVFYGALLDALSKARGKQAAIKSQEILDRLEGSSKQSGFEYMAPTKRCYTSVIVAWGGSGVEDAPERAQDVLERLQAAYEKSQDESLRPDSYTYSAMLGVWANSKYSNAGERAEALLNHIEDRSHDKEALLNKFLYTNVIRAHWKSGKADAGEKAEAVLHRMEELASKSGGENVKPDTVAYSCVINAWARSASPQKAKHAWSLFQRMCKEHEDGNLDVAPNTITLTSVLNACLHTRGSPSDRADAVEIALNAMHVAVSGSYGRPNHVTFRTLLSVFGYQVSNDSDRLNYSASAFELCAKQGQVDTRVLDTVKRCVPELYRKLPRDSHGQPALPATWSRNVEPQ